MSKVTTKFKVLFITLFGLAVLCGCVSNDSTPNEETTSSQSSSKHYGFIDGGIYEY